MKKITREEFEALRTGLWGLSSQGYGEFSNFMERHWERIQEAQTELERKEDGMTVEEIENVLHHRQWYNKRELAVIIQPLTRPQGFVPNWKEAPGWARGVEIHWSTMPSCADGRTYITRIPRPVPNTREMTNTEMAKALCEKLPDQEWVHPVFWQASNDKLKEACRAANISTTVEEGE